MTWEEKLVEVMIEYELRKAVSHYGLEGALEAIERVYSHPSSYKILEHFRKTFKRIYLNA